MLLTSGCIHGCWWIYVAGNFWVLMTEIWYRWHLLNVGAIRLCWVVKDVTEEKGQNRHQHLKVVANTFRLQHPSPTSMLIVEQHHYCCSEFRNLRNSKRIACIVNNTVPMKPDGFCFMLSDVSNWILGWIISLIWFPYPCVSHLESKSSHL